MTHQNTIYAMTLCIAVMSVSLLVGLFDMYGQLPYTVFQFAALINIVLFCKSMRARKL